MKKYIYILFAALLAVACVEPLQPYLGPIINEPEEGTPVTIEFSLPPMTKGTMAHDPDISTIHVAVFNERGILKQYEKAKLTNPENVMNGDNPNGNPTYSVEINMSSSKRILHFIGDSPVDSFDDLVAIAGTSGEDAILNALTTAGGEGAYWQRYVLDKIDAYTYQGGVYVDPDGGRWGAEGATQYSYEENNQTITVYSGDFIKRDGHKVLDGTGYFASTEVSEALANIPFIRNFAEVTVSSDPNGTNFRPTRFALMNVPKAGYVAPFDTKKDAFAVAYIGKKTLTHTAVAGSNYPGYQAGSIDPTVPTTFIDLTSTAANAVKTAYMYERTLPNPQQPATCVLVEGYYDEDGDGTYPTTKVWFKFEITDTNGGYFPIYRGLSYDIRIGIISGAKGYATAALAAASDAIGDISGSPTTATLEQISDGKGTTLWVEYIDYVATGAEEKTILYTMYYTNPSTGAITYLYDGISITSESITHPDENYKAITETPVVASGTFNSGTPDDSKVWKKATVKLGASGQHPLHSILRVQGTSYGSNGNNGKPMYRDVHYRVLNTQKFENGTNKLKATPLENENAGQITTLTIYLPNDLGFSMFPLTLRIEAQNGSYTTVDGLPVESGPSLFDETKNSFYFLKTIEYSDYFDSETGTTTTAFTTRFKTTRNGTTSAAGTNATTFAVLDKVKSGRETPYFEMATCNVSVGGPIFALEQESITVNANVTEVQFNIKSTGDENPTWNLTPSSNISSLSTTSGTGNATITVRIPENTSETNSVTYTVTAKRTGFDDLVFTITQDPVSTLVAVTRTIQTNSSYFTNAYVYNGEFSSEVSIAFSGGQYRSTYYLDFNPTGSGVTIEANTITRIVITWWGESYAADNSSVGNGGGSITYSNPSSSYPTTTWTGSSNSVSLNFARNGNSSTEFTIRQIEITYLHEPE
ncbi:MAG: BACON domain-containing protein [Bacteroidales bacterium]|nr:BACON domain-containing protein [Bacteroidales bacterium]